MILDKQSYKEIISPKIPTTPLSSEQINSIVIQTLKLILFLIEKPRS